MSTGRYFNVVVAIAVALSVLLASGMIFLSGNEQAVAAMTAAAEMPYEGLFDSSQVMQIEIEIDRENWEDILADPVAEEYHSCDVKVNGEIYTDVGIRTKGNTSLSQVAESDSDRYSFKLEFDHYDKNKSLDGLDKLVLNNLFSDATYVKEYISYDIFRYAGVKTPYYAFAALTVNGEYYGCYLALEAMEDSFLERTYGNEGQLYKPESNMAAGGGRMPENFGGRPGEGKVPEVPEGMPGNFGVMPGEGKVPEEFGGMPEDFGEKPGEKETPEGFESTGGNRERPEGEFPGSRDGEEIPDRNFGSGRGAPGMESGGGSDLAYTGDDPDSYSDIFDNAVFDPTDEDKQRLIRALEKLNQGDDPESCVNVDACLRYFAAQTFIVNLDSYYSNLKHNYYLYEKEGQLTILPWDLNLAFGGFQSRDATEAVNNAIDTPMGDGLEEARPLFGRLMEVEEYRDRYHDYLKDIVEGYAESGIFTDTITKLENLISPWVEKETNGFYSYSEFREGIMNLKAFVFLRAESVKKQISGAIPSEESKRGAGTVLVDASGVDLEAMGVQGGGMHAGSGRFAH